MVGHQSRGRGAAEAEGCSRCRGRGRNAVLRGRGRMGFPRGAGASPWTGNADGGTQAAFHPRLRSPLMRWTHQSVGWSPEGSCLSCPGKIPFGRQNLLVGNFRFEVPVHSCTRHNHAYHSRSDREFICPSPPAATADGEFELPRESPDTHS